MMIGTTKQRLEEWSWEGEEQLPCKKVLATWKELGYWGSKEWLQYTRVAATWKQSNIRPRK